MIIDSLMEIADGLDLVISDQELILLAQLIEAEAEAEPLDGKVAVGAVILNRMRSSIFPTTVTEIINQPGQFESVSNGRLASIKEAQKETIRALELALLGTDPTGGALYFFNPSKTNNQWLKKKQVKLELGNHVFVV